ncbi:L,D-transpeptidase family protein [Aurantiacibacter sediminis]|uniref:Murein L,D-transpeptidase n=1 Tax=Aurantiacibacter sediminis TaxID=2793064 RepID=A0ABS0N4M7_9SPHN|nr:L,D-transpeptidase family protein [Aurantiacibacter sediminis]MBH5322480.1 murein L,D-transpeptidase [Aurantiacibacter sediminis]
MKRSYLSLILALPLAACGLNGTDSADSGGENETAQTEPAEDFGYETYGDDNYADTMASNDAAYTSIQRNSAPTDEDGSEGMNGSGIEGADTPSDIPDSQDRPIMQAQVVLDRRGFGPGVIDGRMGMSTENALRGFQEANDLEITGELDRATEEALSESSRIPATRVVTIPAGWGDIEFTDIPEDTAAKAEMDNLGYKSLDEKLAERFHTTVEVLRELNPNGRPAGAEAPDSSSTPSPTPTASGDAGESDSYFRVGQQIRVPNIGADRIAPGSITDRGWQQTLAALGVGSEQPQVDRIVVSKSASTLKAYQGDTLVAMFTVSSGSSQFPLPIGEWDIVGEAYNPPYSYDPAVLSGGEEEGETYTLPPGPNGPVGVIWIDLSKEHYGIHGTPDPETIGRAQSSGCVRLTNWDAARLAGMVDQDTQVIFEE